MFAVEDEGAVGPRCEEMNRVVKVAKKKPVRPAARGSGRIRVGITCIGWKRVEVESWTSMYYLHRPWSFRVEMIAVTIFKQHLPRSSTVNVNDAAFDVPCRRTAVTSASAKHDAAHSPLER